MKNLLKLISFVLFLSFIAIPVHAMDSQRDGVAKQFSQDQLNHQLFDAVKQNKPVAVHQLLLSNADVNAHDAAGMTSLMRAAENGFEPICKLLLDNGADVNARTKDDNMALTFAAQSGHELICRLLLDNGANVNAQDVDGDTVLMDAAGNGFETICKLFLDHGADVNARAKDENMALMCAAINGRASTSKLLLDRGADVNASNDDGDTALIGAVGEGHGSICTLFLDYGADICAKNGLGSTAFKFIESVDVIQPLITYPIFNPIRTEAQLKISHQRVLAGLCALKRAWPTLTRDLRYLILNVDDALREDVRNCAFGIHRGHNERAPFLPMQVVRRLIRNRLFHPDFAVAAIKANHFVQIKPLMSESLEDLDSEGDVTFKILLNTDNLEANYGKEIESNIRRRLGLPEAIPMVEFLQEDEQGEQKEVLDAQDVRLKERKRLHEEDELDAE